MKLQSEITRQPLTALYYESWDYIKASTYRCHRRQQPPDLNAYALSLCHYINLGTVTCSWLKTWRDRSCMTCPVLDTVLCSVSIVYGPEHREHGYGPKHLEQLEVASGPPSTMQEANPSNAQNNWNCPQPSCWKQPTLPWWEIREIVPNASAGHIENVEEVRVHLHSVYIFSKVLNTNWQC